MFLLDSTDYDWINIRKWLNKLKKLKNTLAHFDFVIRIEDKFGLRKTIGHEKSI